jgi:hypothetical protein
LPPQTWPQPPQFVVSPPVVFLHAPEQHDEPEPHAVALLQVVPQNVASVAKFLHVPPQHVSPAPQARSHMPQFMGSFARSLQTPLQHPGVVPPHVAQPSPHAVLSVSLSTQRSPQHLAPAPSPCVAQLFPHAPQCASLFGSDVHTDAQHAFPESQTLAPPLHAPQWLGSFVRLTHDSPQHVSLAPQGLHDPQWSWLSRTFTHVPPQQRASAPVQVVPPSPRHAPQCVSEVSTSTQLPPQHVSEPVQARAAAHVSPHAVSSVRRSTQRSLQQVWPVAQVVPQAPQLRESSDGTHRPALPASPSAPPSPRPRHTSFAPQSPCAVQARKHTFAPPYVEQRYWPPHSESVVHVLHFASSGGIQTGVVLTMRQPQSSGQSCEQGFVQTPPLDV